MRLAFLLLLSIISLKIIGQDSSKVIGRWQVVAVDNGVRYDYKTDKYTVSKTLQDSLAKWKGSLFNLDDYISWAASCANCYFVFTQDGHYEELRGSDVQTEGTFQLNRDDTTMTISLKVREQNISKIYGYYLIGRQLILKVPSFFLKGNQRILLEMERSE